MSLTMLQESYNISKQMDIWHLKVEQRKDTEVNSLKIERLEDKLGSLQMEPKENEENGNGESL